MSPTDLVKAGCLQQEGRWRALKLHCLYEVLSWGKSCHRRHSRSWRGGRKLSYVATVQGNGNLLIGKAYTAMLDLKPGDNFQIKLGKKAIRLIPEGASEDSDD